MNTQDWSWQRYADDPGLYRMDGANFHPGPNWGSPGPKDYQSLSHPEGFEPDYLDWRMRRLQAHDAAYRRWRAQEAARYDEHYQTWRDERRSGFHTAFDTWRARQDGGKDVPLDAASVEFSATDSARAPDGAAPDPGSPQINDIADGGAGHGHPSEPR
jgi:hypothetical protein